MEVLSAAGDVTVPAAEFTPDPNTGKFTATFKTPLLAYQLVRVTGEGSNGAADQGVVAEVIPAPSAITIQQVPESTQVVKGEAAGFDHVKVQVLQGRDVVEQTTQPVDTASGTTTGQFSANLTRPVGADETIRVTGQAGGVTSDKSVTASVTPAQIDWGLIRTYFTSGVVLAANSNSFSSSNASAFLGMAVDSNWFNTLKNRFHGNSFFDLRLTSIATAQTGSATTPAQTSSSTTTPSATPTPTPNPVSSSLSNHQAAELETGMYFPITLGNWNFRGHSYSGYLAPIFEAGLYTWNEAGSASANGATQTSVNPSSFYKFYAAGLRFGNYREHPHWDGSPRENRSPDQLSYIDLMFGRWANFESVGYFKNGPNGICSVQVGQQQGPDCTLNIRPCRVSAQGVLAIPYTPLLLGMSANVSVGHWSRPGYFDAPDDLRFFLGARFDTGSLLGALGKLGTGK